MNPWTTLTANELTPKHAGSLIRLRPVKDDPEVVVQARLEAIAGPEHNTVYLTVKGIAGAGTFGGGWRVPADSDVEVRR